MAAEIYLPKMSDHMEEGTIIRWLVKEGETVTRGQVVLEIETDKAVGEIEASADGVLKGIRAGDGATIPVGETIAYIARPDESIPELPPLGEVSPDGASPSAENNLSALAALQPEMSASNEGPVKATPVARRVAKDLGVDISMVKGTGPGGRVKDADVRAYVAAMSAKTPEISVSTSQSKPVDLPVGNQQDHPLPPTITPSLVQSASTLSLTQIQQITGQRMLESVQQAPHFFLQVSANMLSSQHIIERARQRMGPEGVRPSITAILIKAVSMALKKYPRANSKFLDNSLILFPEVNIGVAVGAEDGLLVPVIKNADWKSLTEISRELKDFQAKARDLRFSPDDLSGGTFTVSNLGMYGVDVFTAIINPPQSSILAVGRIIQTPVGLDDGSIVLQPMMALSLSVDHRCMDGLQGAKFLTEIKTLLEEPYLMI